VEIIYEDPFGRTVSVDHVLNAVNGETITVHTDSTESANAVLDQIIGVLMENHYIPRDPQ